MTEKVWGHWTAIKLDLLDDYLREFTTASSRASHAIYIDAFAGVPDNIVKSTGMRINSSPYIALSIAPYGFTNLYFFEKCRKADELEKDLVMKFPDRKLKVVSGDANETVKHILSTPELLNINYAPTFAFIDPNSLEAEWVLLKSIANFRQEKYTKAEILYLFSSPMFQRCLPIEKKPTKTAKNKISKMFGTTQWKSIYYLRKNNKITALDARYAYINLMRWRLETVLKYKKTHTIGFTNSSGNLIYNLIFASDHDVGDKIMKSLFSKYTKHILHQGTQIKDNKKGVEPLLELTEDYYEVDYQHAPPIEPEEYLNSKLTNLSLDNPSSIIQIELPLEYC